MNSTADAAVELDNLKRSIQLAEYVAAHGWVEDVEKTCSAWKVMRKGDQEIIVHALPSGHFGYFNRDGGSDRGTIIDFAKNHQGLSIGKLRIILRKWLASPRPEPQVATTTTGKAKSAKPAQQADKPVLPTSERWAGFSPILQNNHYLTKLPI